MLARCVTAAAPITLRRLGPLARPVSVRASFVGADDHAEAVDIERLAFRVDDSDAGNALLRPLRAKRSASDAVCAWVRINAPSRPAWWPVIS